MNVQHYLKLHCGYYVVIVCCISVIAAYIQQEYLVIPQLENMPIINDILKRKILNEFQKLRWLSLLLAPIIILLRVSLVASCFFVGSLLFDGFGKLEYGRCFNVALKADVILLFSAVISSAILLFAGNESTVYVSKCMSLLYFFDLENIEPWLVMPIGVLNVFEAVYWFFMAALLAVALKKSYKDALNFVLCTYGTGLVLFILFIIFVTLYISQ